MRARTQNNVAEVDELQSVHTAFFPSRLGMSTRPCLRKTSSTRSHVAGPAISSFVFVLFSCFSSTFLFSSFPFIASAFRFVLTRTHLPCDNGWIPGGSLTLRQAVGHLTISVPGFGLDHDVLAGGRRCCCKTSYHDTYGCETPHAIV